MSATNFCTMQDFPLYVIDFNEDVKHCSTCGAILVIESEHCEECGSDELDSCIHYDELYAMEICGSIEERLDEFNDGLLFHTVKLRSGYYSGMQFYVQKDYALEAEDFDNDDCHYYFGCCRSEAYRKYAAEVKKVTKELNRLAKEYGFTELVSVARFSNGEAIYEKADSHRARIYSAVV